MWKVFWKKKTAGLFNLWLIQYTCTLKPKYMFAVAKACVTNPIAAGLLLSLCHKSMCRWQIFSCWWFHRLAAHFSTSYGCSSKLAWKRCTIYIAVWVQTSRRCGAAQHWNCLAAAVVHQYSHFRRWDGFHFTQLSPASALILAAHTIYAATQSPHGTTSDRPIPQISSAKYVVRHCEFSEKRWILEEHYVSNDATENAWFLSNLICLPGNCS
jgi:hypothetical protein